MTTTISGIVSNGLVIPTSPLPEGARVEITFSSTIKSPAMRMTPTELRKLPREQQDAILAEAAKLAEEDYLNDKELTGFDAFSEESDDDSE